MLSLADLNTCWILACLVGNDSQVLREEPAAHTGGTTSSSMISAVPLV